jgi:hypothetical protein
MQNTLKKSERTQKKNEMGLMGLAREPMTKTSPSSSKYLLLKHEKPTIGRCNHH